jgi:glucose-6-phosphate 1-epimerase
MPRTLILVPGPGGLSKILLAGPGGSRAEVSLHGAQVLSWCLGDGRERLFLSEWAECAPGRALRGGIPVIFPQVAGEGPLSKHGFARTLAWQALETKEGQAHLRLRDSETTRALWPHAFQADLRVILGRDRLTVTMSILNPGKEPISFTCALHPYLRVEDITRVTLTGLQNYVVKDLVQGTKELEKEELRFGQEVERLYLDAPQPQRVLEGSRITEINAEGFRDLLVWNPGPVGGDKLRDLEPEGYRRMLCLEAAAWGSPITLAPGEKWEGSQTLAVLS